MGEDTVRLEGRATIEQVREVCERVREAMTTHKNVTIDLTDVTRIDIAFVQLLVSAAKTARERGVGLTVRADEAMVVEASGGSQDVWTALL
jgi:anti-anti-sigma regulatory factor